MNGAELTRMLEAVLLTAGQPVSLERLMRILADQDEINAQAVREALARLAEDCRGRALTLAETASGYHLQVCEAYAPYVLRLWEERPPRYSRALLETLALIVYRQPITRSEIEAVRGVAVSASILRTLTERGWVRVVGHREVPGRPALYGSTAQFLDDFNLKSLDELPPLATLDIPPAQPELPLAESSTPQPETLA